MKIRATCSCGATVQLEASDSSNLAGMSERETINYRFQEWNKTHSGCSAITRGNPFVDTFVDLSGK